MKITAASFRKEELGLTRPYTISYKTVDNVAVTVVELQLANGKIGLGSSNPSKPVVGESVVDTQRVLGESGLDWLVGQDIRNFYGLMRQVRQRYAAYPGAAAAVDIALHDLFGQYLEVPVVGFLGQQIESLYTSITIGIKTVSETLAEAEEYYGRGFRILKVKLGHNLDDDVERLAKLREVYGQRMKIRIDANQGYQPEQVEAFYRRTLPFDLELIEQPVPVGQTLETATLPQEIRDATAADESLVSPKDAMELAFPPSPAGIYNIKLMKCGGVYPAQQIATIAEFANKSLMWGCNDESIISIAAALHVALSAPHTKYIDLDGSLDLARDVVNGGFILKDGKMSVNTLPGLGLQKAFDLA